ncbi:MAG TPA: cupin domain-containing protein [Actinomycetota bacterium]|nr:cupin domain-containing protein [Actinomycetota bacterium]
MNPAVVPPPDQPNPFLCHLSQLPPTNFQGGYLIGANEQTFPILSGQSGAVYLLQLDTGGVREPHWHPTAWEANYVISGQAQWSVLSTHPENQYLNCQFDVGPGDLVFIPAGYFHYFQNASSSEPLLLLIAFNSSLPEPDDDIGIVGSVSAIPDAVLDLVFKVPAGTFAQIPKNFDPVVITQGPPPTQ